MKNKIGFTLAEMMVVMLIVSLVTVAMLPVMTGRSDVNIASPWKYSANKSDIYFGLNDTQGAVIGANSLAANEKSRLVLNTPTSWSMADAHLVLKNNNTVVAQLSASTNNLALGKDALISNTAGRDNTAIGNHAMHKNTTGSYNTAFGHAALSENTTGSANTSNGYNSLLYNTTGSVNTANGHQTLSYNSTGSNNTANGGRALHYNTTGHSNMANGVDTLFSNTIGFWNTANGNEALYSNQIGYYNTGIGTQALYSNTGGYANTGIGVRALYNNGAALYNTGVGYEADVIGGFSYSTAIGAGASVINGSSQNRMGGFGYATAIGAGASVSSGETVVLGRPIDSVYAGTAGLLMASDKKLKDIKGYNKSGLAELRRVNVYNYTLKSDKQKKLKVGVIAQEIQKIFPNAIGVNAGTLYVNYGIINMAMLNAIKELDKNVQKLAAENKALEARILKLEQAKNLKTSK